MTREPLAVTVWADPAAATGPPVVLVHGTLTWGTLCFAGQRSLSRRYRLLVVDRRGFGASPDLTGDGWTSDYAVDAWDVVDLLGTGAHLVGHSYGGVVAMLAAAAARPDLVRSLALIEPSAHQVAATHPVVAAAVAAARRFMADARRTTPEDYLRTVFDGTGRPRPDPADRLLRAARTALGERPSWLADIPVDQLAAAAFPKLVVTGAWDVPAPGYLPGTGEVLRQVAATVAERIRADLVRVPGAAHEPHRERPDLTNDVLVDLWSGGA